MIWDLRASTTLSMTIYDLGFGIYLVNKFRGEKVNVDVVYHEMDIASIASVFYICLQ
jgi:hypothetical protein